MASTNSNFQGYLTLFSSHSIIEMITVPILIYVAELWYFTNNCVNGLDSLV